MSASTEKKQRQAAREAGTDRKLNAAQEEAKKKARSKRITTIVSICVALLVVLIILLSTGFFYNHTTALTIDGKNYSPAEVNYHYAQQYFNWTSQYGSYASIFGLDTSAGPFGLKNQPCQLLEDGGSWRDYFMQTAYAEMAQSQALAAYAADQGLTVSEEDLADVDEQLSQMAEAAKGYGFSGADNYLEANYGTGVSTRIVRRAMTDGFLATAGYNHYLEQLTYTPEQLAERYASFEGSKDFFDYAFYSVNAATETDDDGNEAAPTEQAMLEARMTAEAVMTSYQDDKDTEDPVERLNAALEAEFEGVSATERSRVQGDSLGDLTEWLTAEHSVGDIDVVENAAGTGYFVVVFLGRDDNHYNTVTVRHILVTAEADEEGNWSDEVKEAAREKAESILDEWKAGEATEESFAALAEQYSEDSGSNTNGGLYENVAKGQMVEEFDAFCFGDRKPGDTAVVFGTNGSYAGYHVIYFVGEGDLYSDTLARDDLQSEDVGSWLDEITPEYKEGPAAWLAGK